MEGYNSAELRTKDEDEKKKGIEAKNKLSELLLNKVVFVKCGEFEKYGRLLATIYLLNVKGEATGTPVNTLMVEQGYGKPYNGQGEKNY